MIAKFSINIRYYTDKGFHRTKTTIEIEHDSINGLVEFLKSERCNNIFSYDYLRKSGKIIFNFIPKHLFKDNRHASFDVAIKEKVGHIVLELDNKITFNKFFIEV